MSFQVESPQQSEVLPTCVPDGESRMSAWVSNRITLPDGRVRVTAHAAMKAIDRYDSFAEEFGLCVVEFTCDGDVGVDVRIGVGRFGAYASTLAVALEALTHEQGLDAREAWVSVTGVVAIAFALEVVASEWVSRGGTP